MLPIINLRKTHFGVLEHLKMEMDDGLYPIHAKGSNNIKKQDELPKDTETVLESLMDEEFFEDDDMKTEEMDTTSCYYGNAQVSAYTETYSAPIVYTNQASFFQKTKNFLMGGLIGS